MKIKLRIISNARIYQLIHLIGCAIFYFSSDNAKERQKKKEERKKAEFISVSYIRMSWVCENVVKN